MQRRRFIQLIGLASATGLAVGALEASDSKTVAYHVSGFTCVTCAVGLETLLRQQKGVLNASASYPDGSVTIKYEPAKVNEDQLMNYIADMGFAATPKQS